MLLSSRLKDKSAKIGILGLGYVGLPLAMEFCRKGWMVTGFEAASSRLQALRRGRSYVGDVSSGELKRAMKAGLFMAADGFKPLSDQDVVIVCVQTPLSKSGEPDISHILSAISTIAQYHKPGRLVVLESTTFPGTTDEIIRPILEKRGRLGKDFFLAFSPERVDPGNSRYRISNTPKVVGGADAASRRLAVALYSQIVSEVVAVSSTRAAEVIKLLENTFRSVNIALINEMAQICHHLGLDIWEIIAAAQTKPFGFMPFYPGPGIGGHCLPKDPRLLSWKMRSLNYEPRFIELASAINGSMPDYVVRRIAEALNLDRKALNASRVLVLGVAYKANVGDTRESPALDVIEQLLAAKAKVSYHDPYVPALSVAGSRLNSMPLTDQALRSCDLVAILTAHKDIDYRRVLRLARRVFDARNATGALDASPRLNRL